MKKAGKANASAAIIFGDDELAQQIVKVKNFDASKESDIAKGDLVGYLKQNFNQDK